MTYSDNFKERCKKAYPTLEVLHKALDENSEWVGRYLLSGADGKVSIEDILEVATLAELHELARVAQEKLKLYTEWCRMFAKSA